VMVDEEDDDCNKVAYALVTEPENDVKNDHGGLVLYIFTMGRCRGEGGPDDVLDPMIRTETKTWKTR
jgi:hypothetical protein